MKRMNGFPGILIGLLFATISWAQVLPVPQKYQIKTQWCWAATSQAVLSYYGIEKTQPEIAQYGTLGLNIWNWLYGESSNPVRRGVDRILYHFAGITSRGYSWAFSLQELKTLIGENKPVPLRWKWDSGGGHILVLHGVTGDTIYLRDSIYGPTINTYSWLLQGGGHRWTHTLKLLSIPTLVEEKPAELPKRYLLLQNYPNPFNASTVLRYVLPHSGRIQIAIFDIRGRQVQLLVNEIQPAGEHQTVWNANTLPSGIYFAVLKSGSRAVLKKLVLQK